MSSRLDEHNKRSVCFGCDKRLSHSICFFSSANSTTIVTGDGRRKTGINLPRNSDFVSQAGNRDSRVSPIRVYFQRFSGPEKERENEASYQSKAAKPICTKSALQNGDAGVSVTSYQKRRLFGNLGSQGRVFLNPDRREPSEVSSLYLERQKVPVPLFTVRSHIVPQGVYEGHETSCGHATSPGDSSGNFLGRFINHGIDGRRVSSSYRDSSEPADESRFRGQSRKIMHGTYARSTVPRFPFEFKGHDDQYFSGEMFCRDRQMQATVGNRSSGNTRGSKCCGPLEIGVAGDSTCESVLQASSTSADSGASRIQSQFQRMAGSSSGGQGGVAVVDSTSQGMEWSTDMAPSSQFGVANRRLSNGMGRHHRRTQREGQRPMESHRSEGAYKCSGSPSSKIRVASSVPVKKQRSYTVADGQCVGSYLRQSPRRNKVVDIERRGFRDVEVVSREKDFDICRTPSRCRELGGRSPIASIFGSGRMVAARDSVSATDKKAEISTGCRSVRVQNKQSTDKIRVMASRPSGMEGGCTVVCMEQHNAVRIPPVLSCGTSSGEGASRSDASNVANSASVGRSVLVRRSSVDVNSATSTVTPVVRPHMSTTQSRASSSGSVDEVSRVDNIRSHLRHAGISGDAASLILASWRKGTEKQYSAAWRVWDRWCSQRSCNPVSTSIANVCAFLTQLYNDGLLYSTINTHRSAISMTHVPVDGVRVGAHYLVCRLMKGIFNQRPPVPRYVFTWPVGQVMRYLKNLGPNEGLILKLLTMKTAILVALVSSDRGATITSLSLEYMVQSDDQVKFLVAKPTKTTRPGSGVKEIVLKKYVKDKRICPVAALLQYIKATAKLRGEERQLFISFQRPFRAVGSSSVARWIRTIMHAAGIDTSVFKPHSTRSAASSQAYQRGVSVPDILKTGDWASATTFQRFYNRPVLHKSFAEAILGGALNSAE